ncbi:MAG: hypothetical protein IAE80_04200, partial [Anaerolinea sp.]|nr:hypothetical protein [Anaerolinea sp.]
MTTIPPLIDTGMQSLLDTLAASMCGTQSQPTLTARRHVWRDVDYVGMADGTVVTWQGWSVNLRPCHPDLRTVYIDYVENRIAEPDRSALFGDSFAAQIAPMSAFVFGFTTHFPASAETRLVTEGFAVRRLILWHEQGVEVDMVTI